MTKDEVYPNRIERVLWDAFCLDCSTDLAGMNHANCGGCYVLIATDAVETQRKVTAKERGE